MLLNKKDTEQTTSTQSENLQPRQTESEMARTKSSTARGRKPIHKKSKVQVILDNLPVGVTYIGPDGKMTEENVKAYAKNPTQFDSLTNLKDECIFESPKPKILRDEAR